MEWGSLLHFSNPKTMGVLDIRQALIRFLQAGPGVAEVQIDSLEGIGDRYIGADSTGKIKAMPDPSPGGGGINQLTGDVTAGPGTGSQAATFRQGGANSILGRFDNSTGAIADIAADANNKFLQRKANQLLFDLIDYSQIQNTPAPSAGVYFSPAQNFDPTFVVFASAIVYPSLPAVNNDPITWGILDQATQHNSSFIESAEPNTANQRLKLNYPLVKNVLNGTVTLDESFAGAGLFVGPTVATSNMEINAYQFKPIAIKLTGNGTGTWTKSGEFDNGTIWDISAYAGGQTSFNIGGAIFLGAYDQIMVVYSGPNNYGIKRVYSGLGSYNAAFQIIDHSTGLPLATDPTSADEIFIHATATQPVQLLLGTWTFANNGWMASVGLNFWIFGVFECYLVAAPVSDTSIQVRWQDLGVAILSYRIARSTSLGGTYVDIYTGLNLSVIDSGLTPNTTYYYKLFYTDGGGETELTYFKTNTQR